MDTVEGTDSAPQSLHKYSYVSANPINKLDPTGHEDADLASNTVTASDIAVLAAVTLITLAYECVAIAHFQGAGPCADRPGDPMLQFYRGASLLEGLDFVSPTPDLTRFITAPNAGTYDFGAGFYMTESWTVAQFFANLNGGTPSRPLKGGPAIIDIQIKQSKWDTLLENGAVEGQCRAFRASQQQLRPLFRSN